MEEYVTRARAAWAGSTTDAEALANVRKAVAVKAKVAVRVATAAVVQVLALVAALRLAMRRVENKNAATEA